MTEATGSRSIKDVCEEAGLAIKQIILDRVKTVKEFPQHMIRVSAEGDVDARPLLWIDESVDVKERHAFVIVLTPEGLFKTPLFEGRNNRYVLYPDYTSLQPASGEEYLHYGQKGLDDLERKLITDDLDRNLAEASGTDLSVQNGDLLQYAKEHVEELERKAYRTLNLEFAQRLRLVVGLMSADTNLKDMSFWYTQNPNDGESLILWKHFVGGLSSEQKMAMNNAIRAVMHGLPQGADITALRKSIEADEVRNITGMGKARTAFISVVFSEPQSPSNRPHP